MRTCTMVPENSAATKSNRSFSVRNNVARSKLCWLIATWTMYMWALRAWNYEHVKQASAILERSRALKTSNHKKHNNAKNMNETNMQNHLRGHRALEACSPFGAGELHTFETLARTGGAGATARAMTSFTRRDFVHSLRQGR